METKPKSTKHKVGRTINIRHPGYDDENNILLKLYACDHPDGGIHYETARIACGILASNRWDGVLTSSSEFREEPVPSTGVFVGKDCYFHLPDWQPRDSNDDAQAARRYPITCRLEEWTFPHEKLPQIWQDAVFTATPQSAVDNSTELDDITSFIQGLISLVPGLNADLASTMQNLQDTVANVNSTLICQLCGQSDEETTKSLLSGPADYKWFMRNKMQVYLSESTTENEDEDSFLDPERVKKLMNDSMRNVLRIGDNCQAERYNCSVFQALYLGQFSFAPKYEQQGKSIIVAVLFAPGDTTAEMECRSGIGISNTRDNPLFNTEDVSIEMIFTRFALNVFWNLHSFLGAGVERKLNLMDHHGQISTLDALPSLCSYLTVPMGALDKYSRDNSNRFTDREWSLTCDGCQMQFSGLRYKCLNCTDFDYCSFCIGFADSRHPDHYFVAIFQMPKPETENDRDDEDQPQAKDLITDVTGETYPNRVAIDISQAIQPLVVADDASLHLLEYETLPTGIEGDQAIRLFNLQPGPANSPVSGDLTVIMLKESPTYEALSYAWGDPAINTNIMISGGRLPVTLNLESALRRLRRLTEPRLLWIDAICINQGDNSEKSSQVQIMRDIYQQARTTLVWLGEGDLETSNAIEMCKREVLLHGEEFLRNHMQIDHDKMGDENAELYLPDSLLSKEIEDTIEVLEQGLYGLDEPEFAAGTTVQSILGQLRDPRLVKNLPQAVKQFQAESRHYSESKEKDAIVAQSSNSVSPSKIVSLYNIFKRAWFHRIWIIQEVSAAADVLVICGNNEINWWIFLIGSCLIEQDIRLGEGIDGLRSFAYISFARQIFVAEFGNTTEIVENTSLLPLLQMYRRFHATDARDKVFALLGLSASTKLIQSIMPNYQHDVTTVYTVVARTSINLSQSLDVLGSVSASSTLSQILPSWVPDWSDTRMLSYPLTAKWLPTDTRRVFSASNDSQMASSENFGGKNLQLEGVLFDALTELGGVLSIEEPAIDITKIINGIPSFGNIEPSGLTTSDLGVAIQAGIFKGFQGLGATLLEPIREYEKIQEIFSQWDSLALSSATEPYITGEDAMMAYYQTLTADVSTPDLDFVRKELEAWQKSRLQGASLFADMRRTLENMENDVENSILEMLHITALLSEFKELDKSLKIKIRRQTKYCRQRRLARTKLGYLGLVPAEAQAGDKVFILKGGKTPYVIRHGEMMSRLVGECYVHGIMYGEAFDETKCRDVVLA